MIAGVLIQAGLAAEKKEKRAQNFVDPIWLETFKRCENSFATEGMKIEYKRYPSTVADVSIWVMNNLKISILISDGFLKVATESQAALMIENLSMTNLKVIRKKNIQKTFYYLFHSIKGDSHQFKYWVFSFLLYPLERFIYGNAKN